MEICAPLKENVRKIVQDFPLTLVSESVIIGLNFIITALKKRSICGRFSESHRSVRGGSRNQRKALWSSIHKRGPVQPVSVNEGETAEEF